MTIHPHHIPDLERLAPYYCAPMLMLGATTSAIPEYPTALNYFGQWVGEEYCDLDLDDGDLPLDLNLEQKEYRVCGADKKTKKIVLTNAFNTVFNFGTIEHVWDANKAWSNALRFVKVGGYFLTHSPVAGYRNHGLRITSEPAIRAFVSKNGFQILDAWITTRPVGNTLWLAAVKEWHIEENLAPAWQVYEEGEKKAVW